MAKIIDNSESTANKVGAVVRKKPIPPKPFKPGQSGNPSGRPKRTEEELTLIEMCKVKTPIALAHIETLMESARSDSVRLGAATYIIDRAYGKAVQHTDNKHTGSLSVMVTAEQAARIAQEILNGSE